MLDLIALEIDRLPRQRRLVFVLSYLSGLTNTEIATRLGISEKSVSNQKTPRAENPEAENKQDQDCLDADPHGHLPLYYPPASFPNELVKIVLQGYAVSCHPFCFNMMLHRNGYIIIQD
ncbi:MAG: sigma factor-like helix-turn-helix DNA-binding protein [Chitinophagales bacterium]